ncbi:MAG: release factor glutamine methyltransferase [Nitrospirales bacterium]|nr:MAG: release factor glutamine methyltransferase [Nitrospirales bacterium]
MSYSQLYREAIRTLSAWGVTNAANEAAWILEQTVGLTRLMIHASPDRCVPDDDQRRALGCIKRRASGEPLQYILGTQEFWGMEFVVSSHVLIPRPESELLVKAVMSRLESFSSPVIVDVGTGSGCLAIALSVERPDAMIVAMDRSVHALRVAVGNAKSHGQYDRVKFCVGDLVSPLSSASFLGKVTAIVANLPYVPERELASLSRDVRDFEPTLALDGGADGLAVYRRLLPEAEGILQPHGHVIVEVGRGQADSLCDEVCRGGSFRVHEIIHDSLGIQRVVCLERTG